ncbi:MAG: NADPH-dependent FMN reductase [Bdellovibrionales bacterium]
MKLNIVITSTRPGRIGPVLADWLYTYAKENSTGFDEIELTDLAALNLPIYDEPNYPAQQNYVEEHTKKWSQIVANSDAFIFVLPEYNFTAPPAFVNAVDYLYHEWSYKPASFVSYGGVSGGLRSVQTAKLILTTLHVMPIPEQVIVPNVFGLIQNGTFTADEHHAQSAQTMIDQLALWAAALAPLRKAA